MITRCRHSRAERGGSHPIRALPVAMASALAACLLLASVGPTRANLVTDPGFESCATPGQLPPPGWTGHDAFCTTAAPHSGSWDAGFVTAALSQNIATTIGDMYEFSFWLRNDNRFYKPKTVN